MEETCDTQDFVPVMLRKKRRNQGPAASRTQQVSFVDRVNSTIAQFEGSEWVQQCLGIMQNRFDSLTWDPCGLHIFCLGLGSPIESKNSLVQLAFITLVCDTFHIDRNKVSFFDPHFSESDVKGLLEMGYVFLSENKRGRYTLGQKTVLFMPHCSVKLYENILRYNWSIEALQQILILGNALEKYIINTPEWKLKTTLPCLYRIGKYFTCDPLPESEAHYSAFNDTALQCIDPKIFALLSDSIWQLPNETEENDSEIA